MALLDNGTQVSMFASGLDHSEGIAWGLDGYVYSGGEAGQIYRISLNSGKVTEIANTGGFILGLALDASNNIYACDVSDRSIKKITPDGYVTTYATGTDEDPFITPNYPVFDSKGNLYVCDSGDWKQDNGKIFKISPGGISEVWDRRLKEFPNGICISPNEGYLVVAMSLNPPRIAKVLIDRDGNPDKIDTLVEIPGTVPDGVLFDRQGFIYVSCYRPDRIYRLSPLGDLEILADDFEGTVISAPTNLAFCGNGLDVLLGTNLGRWHISKYNADAIGLPLNYPELK
tara:strand:+ start:541 stop:1398 length:858 start_codon:yes stop_codon:yes gene_type:complete